MRKFVALLALAPAVFGQTCDPEIECEYTFATPDGVHHRWDFAPLCQANSGDYYFDDGLGHIYYANICGAAAKKCLPKGWIETFEYGVAVQTWGSVPACNLSDATTLTCQDKNGLIPACCTEDCQVLGVGAPTYKLAVQGDINSGVNATFQGTPPDDDDPFWCPWNPLTGSQFPRTVTYTITCDPSVQGAVPLVAIQNKSEDCDYTLFFASNLACPDVSPPPIPSQGPPKPSSSPKPGKSSKLTGGQVFGIIFLVAAFVYIVGGMAWTYRTEHAVYFPNRHFWSSVGDYIGRGYNAMLYCGKSPDTGSYGGSFIGGGAAGPYATTTAPAASGSFGNVGAYGGGSSGGYNAGAPASATAYTDL